MSARTRISLPRRAGLILLAALVALIAGAAWAAAAGIEVVKETHENRFPDSLVFTIQARGDAPIQEATLLYTVTGGAVKGTNRGVPEFQPGTEISATVKIETGNKKYLPPGTGITYWWELKDAAGNTLKTESQTFSYDDQRFKWESLEKGGITLYWYSGGRDRAEKILNAALNAVNRLSKEADVQYNQPMKIWVYRTKSEMDPALPQNSPTYQEQTVTLGVRLSSDVMALLGDHPEVLDTVAHETSHMVINQAIENPFGQLPTWLGEGLAMYAQGDLPPGHKRELEAAKRADQLYSPKTLTSYVGDPSKVNLFYAQSYSFVDFLIKEFGREKMNQLLQVYKRGTTDNRALEEVYGFNLDGLDQRWREWLGAKPRPAGSTGAAASPQAVPTLSLFTLPESSQPGAATAVPSPAAAVASKAGTPVGESTAPANAAVTPAAKQSAAPAAQSSGTLALGLFVVGFLAALVVVLGIALFLLIRARRQTAGG